MTLTARVQRYRVYALRDPDTNEVRYVGQTADFLEGRLAKHCRPNSQKKSERAEWIRSLLAQGKRPTIELLQEFTGPRSTAYAVEHKWAVHFHKEGHRLLNRPLPKVDGR